MNPSTNRTTVASYSHQSRRLGGWAQRGESAALLAIVVLGAALRVYRIGNQPLWVDEGFSEWASRQTYSYLWTVMPTFEPHPPFYYTLLKTWRYLSGDGEGGLRGLSALFGIATVAVVYAIGRMLDSTERQRRTGLLAAALVAASPIHIFYSQEARSYALLAFGVAVSLACALWLMLHPELFRATSDQAVSPHSRNKLRSVLALLLVGIALTLWSHNTGAAAIAAIGCSLIYWWIAVTKKCKAALAGILIIGAGSIALFVPNLAPTLNHVGRLNASSWWLPRPSLEVVSETAIRLYGTPASGGVYALVLFVVLAACGIVLLWSRGSRSAALILGAVATVPPAAELVVSFTLLPVFLERTLLYVNVPVYVAASWAVSQVSWNWWRRLGIVVMLGCLLLASWLQLRYYEKEPWNEIASHLSRSLKDREPVLLLPAWVSPSLMYYAERGNATFQSRGVPFDWPEPTLLSPSALAVPGRNKVLPQDVDRVTELIQGSPRVGLVTRRPDLNDPESLVARVISKTHLITHTKQFGGIVVTVYSARMPSEVAR